MPKSGDAEERENLLAFLEAHWSEFTLREAALLSIEGLAARFGKQNAGVVNISLMFD
jgi:hypothetical protein